MSNNSGMGMSAADRIDGNGLVMRGFQLSLVGLAGITLGVASENAWGLLQWIGSEVYRRPGGQGGGFPVESDQNHRVFLGILLCLGLHLHLPGLAGDDDCGGRSLAPVTAGETLWMSARRGPDQP